MRVQPARFAAERVETDDSARGGHGRAVCQGAREGEGEAGVGKGVLRAERTGVGLNVRQSPHCSGLGGVNRVLTRAPTCYRWARPVHTNLDRSPNSF